MPPPPPPPQQQQLLVAASAAAPALALGAPSYVAASAPSELDETLPPSQDDDACGAAAAAAAAAIPAAAGGSGSGNENGGINEATGDIFGALTEAYANNPNDPADFTVGEEINLSGKGPIRYMYRPSLITNHPDCYTSSISSTEVHAAAGPLNHWFYLVAEGSNPTDGQPVSPTCNNSAVGGIGIQAAGEIYYNAMLSKTSTWKHANVRVATLQAAKNLYPGSCAKFNTVKAAWDAISVPQQSNEPTCSA